MKLPWKRSDDEVSAYVPERPYEVRCARDRCKWTTPGFDDDLSARRAALDHHKAKQHTVLVFETAPITQIIATVGIPGRL